MSMSSLKEGGRPLDIVVWGATGVTGKRVCTQLAELYHGTVKWAIAGRSEAKLTSLREEVVQKYSKCKDIPIIIATVSDKESIDAMVKQAEVVIACAGPFSKYSDAVVESCVKEGTHFVDVTGEAPWVRSVIDRFHDQAVAKGVRVVNFCGFDSVPADMGAYFVVDRVKKRFDRRVRRILGCYAIKSASKMPVSGGTLATMLLMAEADESERKKVKDPYFLNPPGDKPAHKPTRDQYTSLYHEDFGVWTSPFIMQTVNKRVVQRSAALQRELYGPAFDYAEAMKEKSRWSAFISYLLFWFTLVLLFFRPFRSVILHSWKEYRLHVWYLGLLFALGALPRPGEGPSVEDEVASSWSVSLHAIVELDASTDEQPFVPVRASVSDKFGAYTSTARMVTECAMCIVADKEKLVERSLPEGGVLTPAVAFGDVLIQRLNAIGIQFRAL